MAIFFSDKKYKGWTLKTESNVFSDFTFQTLKNQLPSVEAGGFPSFHLRSRLVRVIIWMCGKAALPIPIFCGSTSSFMTEPVKNTTARP